MSKLIHISDTLLIDHSKDAYGFRKRDYKEWWTEEEIACEHTYLDRLVQEDLEERRIEEASYLKVFAQKVKEVMKNGAPNWHVALDWMMATNHPELEKTLWEFGLSRSQRKKIEKVYLAAKEREGV